MEEIDLYGAIYHSLLDSGLEEGLVHEMTLSALDGVGEYFIHLESYITELEEAYQYLQETVRRLYVVSLV